jgi:hypothetical protein
LNLVLDQHQRHKDLYYNIRVYSSEPFETGRAQLGYKFKQSIAVPSCRGGGVPSSSDFYCNPQFMLHVDRDQVKNWAAVEARPAEVLVTYKSDDEETSCKLFLCKAAVGSYLISEINDQTINDIEQKSVSLRRINN